MQNRTAAMSMADTLTWTLPDGRDVLLNLSYASQADELPDAATRVVAGMLDAFWNELMELE
jgi:hypothetical protein